MTHVTSGPSYRLAVHDEPPAGWLTRDRVLLAAAVIVYSVTRLVHVPSFRLWFDEIFTMEVGRRDWGSLLWFVKNYDVHPPLFYLLVKLWLGPGGESFVWLGLFPALTAIAALWPILLLARELGLHPRERILVIALMALNGYLTGYAQEFRAYDWLLLLSATSMWLFVRLCNSGAVSSERNDWSRSASSVRPGRLRTLLALGVVNLFLVYLHYYGWLVVGTEGLFLLYWNRTLVWSFILVSAVAVLAYLPWAYMVIQAANHRVASGDMALFYIPPPSVFSVAFFYGALNGLYEAANSTTMGLILFGIPIVLWIVNALRSAGRTSEVAPVRDVAPAATSSALVWLLLFSTLPVGVAFAASRLLPTAVWGQRHLIVVAAPYLMLVAVSIMRLRPPLVRSAMLAGVVAWASMAGVLAQVTPYKTPAWDTLVARVVEATPPGHGTRVYALSEDAAFPMQFYLARAGRSDIEVSVVVLDTPENRERFLSDSKKPYWALTVPIVLVEDVSDLGPGPFWFCEDQDGAALGSPGRPLRRVFADAGYAVGDEMSATLVNRRWNVRAVGVFTASTQLASIRQ